MFEVVPYNIRQHLQYKCKKDPFSALPFYLSTDVSWLSNRMTLLERLFYFKLAFQKP